MATIALLRPTGISWLGSLAGLFKSPPRLQVAALCYRKGKNEPEVLLVTSRGTGRWILPKGWAEVQQTASDTAATEAYEEAGIIGTAEKKPYALFRSFKGLDGGLSVPTRVLVFRLKVDKQLRNFPERGQRKVVWVPISRAVKMADEAGLKPILKRLKAELSNKSLD